MSDITILTKGEVFGDDTTEQLEMFKIRGKKAAISDYAIALGGYVTDYYYTTDDRTLDNRTGWYFLEDMHSLSSVLAVDGNGDVSWSYLNVRFFGVRPALRFSKIKNICSNVMRAPDGVLEADLGLEPDNAVDKKLQQELSNLLGSGKLTKLSEPYTTDLRKCDDFDYGFLPMMQPVYEYKGVKYVRLEFNSYFGDDLVKFSNGEVYKDGDYVWFELKPVRLWIDEKKDKAVFEKIPISGLQFNKEMNYVGDYKKTDLAKYLRNYFLPELIQFNTKKRTVVATEVDDTPKRKSRLQKINPDTTPVTERRLMTDTEIIHSWIEAGQSVLLRGPSGIGKTERIRKLYPNRIELKLTNGMFPEKVVGSMNLQTGQSVPPDFAKQIYLRCANDDEREQIRTNIQNLYTLADEIYERSKSSSEKIVILLDELLNVNQNVQSLVYTLVLNKFIESGEGLKLPENVVIVATGNQKKYSSAAYDLNEVLEKRFDHVYDMNPKVGEWIYEYAIPNKIHPTVISYILSKYIERGRSEDINNMDYFYEEPEVGETHLDQNGCRGRTNDPRGWTAISNILYNFESDLVKGKFRGIDVENLLQISINTKLRDEWAREFYDYYNIPTISVEEVVSGNYSQADLPQDINERFACVTSLLLAEKNQVRACRDFIREYCDPEYLQIFDISWIGNDEERMLIISELQSEDLSKGGVKR